MLGVFRFGDMPLVFHAFVEIAAYPVFSRWAYAVFLMTARKEAVRSHKGGSLKQPFRELSQGNTDELRAFLEVFFLMIEGDEGLH